jgi:hypothetical protein
VVRARAHAIVLSRSLSGRMHRLSDAAPTEPQGWLVRAGAWPHFDQSVLGRGPEPVYVLRSKYDECEEAVNGY